MELEFLDVFAALAETENLSETADLLNMSQSAVSAGLSRLEKDVGCTLFDRNGKRLHLNENGKYFLEWSQRLRKWNQNTVERLKMSNTESGVIKIGVLIENDTLYFMLTEFQDRYPDIRVELYDEKSLLDDLMMTDMDMFAVPESMTAGMEYAHLARQTGLFLLTKEGSKYSGMESVSLKDLENERFVFAAGSDGKIERVYDICRENGLDPKVAYLCEGPNAKINIILNTNAVGVAYNTMRHFRQSIRGLSTISVELENSVQNHIVLAWKPDSENPLTKVFAEFAKQFKRDPSTLVRGADTQL